MPKQKLNLNSVYISERLQECLRPISRCAVTTVVAPMGHGKTTAVNWYLDEKKKAEDAVVIRINIYQDNLAIFWKSAQDAFAFVGLDFLRDYNWPDDAASAGLFADDFCRMLIGQKSCYIFIDDYHLLTDSRVVEFLCTLADRMPENVHLIVASRDRFLPGKDEVRMGRKLHQIRAEHLRLNHTELSVYAHRCGTDLSDEQIETLLQSSEGWFSAVYLNLRTFSECGVLPDENSNIYEMFSAAMIDPLPAKQQEFLAVMGLANEFTAQMAQFITKNRDTDKLLTILTEQNAFVSILPDGVTFRFHHMMKECAQRAFSSYDPKKQRLYHNRYGEWYETHGLYLQALNAYKKGENFDAMLRVIQNDAGIMLASLKPTDVSESLARCPEQVLKNHPLAILVLMRRMFTWKQIPKMIELKALLLDSVKEHPDMTDEERGNLRGECDLIMSFLMYNDITQMSRLHRSASAQMSRAAVSIRNEGSWTFGSPSVLMMFHREHGSLSKELEEMNGCMPHYYKITDGHGLGAELVMSAEAAFMQGRFADAQIMLERAYARIEENGQENIGLCCDFLARRLSVCYDTEERYTLEQKRKELTAKHDMMWLNILNSTSAYYYALLGQTRHIPPLFAEHALSAVNLLEPCKPMMELIENQVYLAQGAYAKVIGRSERLLGMCTGLHYALVALHVQIQTAAAYEMLGKRAGAGTLLEQALKDAMPDGLVIPFVENYRYLKALLGERAQDDFVRNIAALGKDYELRSGQISERAPKPAVMQKLTERELIIAGFIAAHLSNKEIAEKMFLSEGTVKQYMNRIYSKLQIEGDTRTKRKRIKEMMEQIS